MTLKFTLLKHDQIWGDSALDVIENTAQISVPTGLTVLLGAWTPDRTDTLARIMRVREAKALLSAAAQKAQKESDRETLQEIVEMAKPYAAREAVVLDKFRQR